MFSQLKSNVQTRQHKADAVKTSKQPGTIEMTTQQLDRLQTELADLRGAKAEWEVRLGVDAQLANVIAAVAGEEAGLAEGVCVCVRGAIARSAWYACYLIVPNADDVLDRAFAGCQKEKGGGCQATAEPVGKACLGPSTATVTAAVGRPVSPSVDLSSSVPLSGFLSWLALYPVSTCFRSAQFRHQVTFALASLPACPTPSARIVCACSVRPRAKKKAEISLDWEVS